MASEMNVSKAFMDTIQAYLENKVESDNLFAVKYANPSKSVEECCTFIINEVKKSGCNGFADDEIFGMAIHYYEESEIEVGEPINCKVAVNHVVELTEEEKAEARQKAIGQLQREEADRLRRKAEKPNAQQPKQEQPSLFDL